MTMKDNLTSHEDQLLRFLETYLVRHHRAPTYDELGEALDIPSKDHVSRDLRRLESKGYVSLVPRIARGIRLLRTADGRPFGFTSVPVPVLGTISAGKPIPVPGSDLPLDELDTIQLTREIVGRFSDVYALRVKGNSMIDALISDGDIVVMRHQPRVENGEMAAVWLTDREETTLKRFYAEGDRVRLQPENREFEPIVVPAQHVRVQGKVIAVIRQT